jgi:hypothetical protein
MRQIRLYVDKVKVDSRIACNDVLVKINRANVVEFDEEGAAGRLLPVQAARTILAAMHDEGYLLINVFGTEPGTAATEE